MKQRAVGHTKANGLAVLKDAMGSEAVRPVEPSMKVSLIDTHIHIEWDFSFHSTLTPLN